MIHEYVRLCLLPFLKGRTLVSMFMQVVYSNIGYEIVLYIIIIYLHNFDLDQGKLTMYADRAENREFRTVLNYRADFRRIQGFDP